MKEKSGAGLYRYGFQGQEKDDEVKGSGNHLDYGARCYDSRLARFNSLDAYAAKFPSESPYSMCANNPLLYVDPDGNTRYRYIHLKKADGSEVVLRKKTGKGVITEWFTVVDKKTHKPKYTENRAYDEEYHWYYEETESGDFELKGVEKEKGKYRGTVSNDLTAKWEIDGYGGEGGEQRGGVEYQSDGGGSDPTKFKSLSSVESRNIQGLLDALGVLGKPTSIPKDKVDKAVGIVENAAEIIETVWGESSSESSSNQNESNDGIPNNGGNSGSAIPGQAKDSVDVENYYGNHKTYRVHGDSTSSFANGKSKTHKPNEKNSRPLDGGNYGK